MKFRRLHTLNFLLAAFMTMAAGVSCVEPYDDTQPDTSSKYQLSFQVAASGADLMTKADVTGTETENLIHDLRVWAFIHSGTANVNTEKAVGYANPPIATPADHLDNVTIPFPTSVEKLLDNADHVYIDLYVLANAPSVGCTLAGLEVTRTQLEEAKITVFGTECVSVVPANGLPMTGTLSNVDITFLKNTGTGSLSSPISLKRAVSKIRFVFAKASNMTADTEITSIEIVDRAATEEAEMLPTYSYLFKEEVSSETEALKWPNTGKLLESFSKTIDTPLRLRWDYYNRNNDKSIVDYETFLSSNDVVGSTEQKVLYLRESKKDNIKIKINYKIGTGTDEKSAYIAIPNGAKLARNSWWTVYAYFMSFELDVQITKNDYWDGYEAVNVAG